MDNFNIINDVSLNLFIGVSGGVEAFEAGVFINVDRYYVDGVQVAGFGNTVGGYASGAQMAGFYNVTGAYVRGFQGAGFVNVAGAEVNGAQAAGFANVAGSNVSGFQGAGFINVAGADVKGVQAAGFINVTGAVLDGFQGAGFLNLARESVNGVQAAGLGNMAGEGFNHFQGAGFFNVADEVKGLQLAGFMNICDSIEGIPLAFISIVKKNGYKKFAFTLSEVQYANISYKMGVKHFYNIYSFGKPFGPGSRWMFGGGLGTGLDLSENVMLNIEGTVHQELWIAGTANPHFLYIDRLNLYNSVKFLFGWNMENQAAIHIGPTFNVSVSHSNPDVGVMAWHEIAPYSIYNHTSNNSGQTNVQMWVGLQGSVSF